MNKAMDVEEECLDRQGKKFENLSHKIAMMFVCHCSDPDLAQIFKSKSVEKLTVSKTQEQLDEYQREQRRTANCLTN